MDFKRIKKGFSYIVILFTISLLVVILFDTKFSKPSLVHSSKTFEQELDGIKTQGIKNLDIISINKKLTDVDKTDFSELDKAKLKREIIREYGFVNFDWKGTLADVTSFQNIYIEIVEIKSPITLYRRGYPEEPSSKFGLGRWWSDKVRTIEDARNELAILSNWGNPLTGSYQIQIPLGAKLLKGIAAPQEFRNPGGEVIETRIGGGVQYFIDAVNNDWLQGDMK
jgi:hypothetical protein